MSWHGQVGNSGAVSGAGRKRQLAGRIHHEKGAQERIDSCLGVSAEVPNETLRHIQEFGGPATLLYALNKTEKQFLWYSDLHSKKPDPVKATCSYEYADTLTSFLPKTEQSETRTADYADVSPLSGDEAERRSCPNREAGPGR